MTKPDMTPVVRDVAEVFQFEHWIRFYFLEEREEGKLFVNIPEEVVQIIHANHAHLAGLVPLINQSEIDYAKSVATVSEYVASKLDGDKYEANSVGAVLDSKAFKVEMYVFNLWIKGHEEMLDEVVYGFDGWADMYREWKAQDEVKAYILKLHSSGTGALDLRSDTVQ